MLRYGLFNKLSAASFRKVRTFLQDCILETREVNRLSRLINSNDHEWHELYGELCMKEEHSTSTYFHAQTNTKGTRLAFFRGGER